MKALNLILFSRPIDIGHKLLIVGSGLRFIVPQKMLKQTYKRTCICMHTHIISMRAARRCGGAEGGADERCRVAMDCSVALL